MNVDSKIEHSLITYSQCAYMSNLIVNGEFTEFGDKWTHLGATFDGKTATVKYLSNPGYIEQEIILEAPLKKDDAVRVKFNISDLKASFSVTLEGAGSRVFRSAGHYDIAFVLSADMTSNRLALKFGALNTLVLDDVWLEIENKGCTPRDVIKNGDFSGGDEDWTYDGFTTFVDGKANVAGVGHIKQAVTLDRPLTSADIVKVKFTLSNVYGDVTVSVGGTSHQPVNESGVYTLALPILSDQSDTVAMLRFQAENAFDIDDISMIVCM